jgi:two-component system nitrate/nitrite response regulator NarL
MNVKLLLVDDHPMMLLGLSQTVAQQPNLTLVGQAPTGALALKLARELTPDIVVMDVHLPDMDGIEAARQMLSALPATKIIMLSGDATRVRVGEALEAGACGYLSKSSDFAELVRAIDLVMEGRLYLGSEVSAGILEDYRKSVVQGPEPSKPLLTERDKQFLRLIAEGRRNRGMAESLAVTINSVETYRSRLMKKLGCASTAEMVRYAIRHGIVQP